MSIKEKAVKGIAWSALQNWGSQFGALLIFFVLARLLKPEAFGLVAIANAFLALMQTFLNQGFSQALIQRKDLEPEHLDTAFWTNLAIGGCLSLVSFAIAPWIANGFGQPSLTGILRGFSPLFLINAFATVQQAVLERNFAFKAIAIRSLVGTVAGGIVGVGLALNGFGVWSLVYQQVVQELISTFVLWKLSQWRPHFRVSLPHFQHLFHFGINIFGFNVLSFLNSRADDFLIGYFLGPIALGYYSIAYRILGIMQLLLVNTSKQVALPTLSKLQHDLSQFREAFYTATQLTSFIAFPCFLGVVTLAPELITLLFGPQWIPSIPVLQVLAFAGILQCVSFFKSSVFIALGKPAWAFQLTLLSACLNLVGFTIAVRWGIVAVAVAFLIRGCLVFPIGQWAVSRLIHSPVLVYLHHFVAPLSSAIVMAIALLTTKQILLPWVSTLGLLVICSVVGAVVYGLMIYLLSPTLFSKVFDVIRLLLSNPKRQDAK
jgi:O-antigen/teichoic acid export membrane protein